MAVKAKKLAWRTRKAQRTKAVPTYYLGDIAKQEKLIHDSLNAANVRMEASLRGLIVNISGPTAIMHSRVKRYYGLNSKQYGAK